VQPEQRIVTAIPLKKIWDHKGPLSGERLRHLEGQAIRELLRMNLVQFIEADCDSESPLDTSD
jgi:hypothetical protein